MSKRRHGGVGSRKSSNIVAKEGWSERESNIADFMKHSLEQTNSQYDLDIESASSDEEDKPYKPGKEAIVQKVYKFNLNQKIGKDNGFCNFNEKLKDFGIYKRKKVIERYTGHKSSNLCLNSDSMKDNCCFVTNTKCKISKIENSKKNTLSINFRKVIENSNDRHECLVKQANSHLSEENDNTLSTLSTVKNRVDESDDEKELKISPVIVTDVLMSEKLEKYQQEIKETVKYTSSCNLDKSSVISDTNSPTFKTQKRFVKSSFTPLSPRNKSPVFSSRRKSERKMLIAAEHCSPVLKSKVKSVSSSLEANTQNIVELESPILKSKNLKCTGSPVFNSRKVIKRKLTFGCYSAPNKLIIRDASFQPQSEHSTRNVFWESKKGSDINVSTPLSRNENSINRIKKKQRSLVLAFAEEVEGNYGKTFEIKESQSESENARIKMELGNVDSISNDNFSLQQNNVIFKKSKRCTAGIDDHNNKADSNLKMKKYISVLSSSLNGSEQSYVGIEDVNETIKVQTDSQVSEPIEECLTPNKETSSYNGQHHTDKSTPLVLENEGGQKGSEWLRAINYKTPERPSKDNEQIADPDSSKKKILKDGLAARLRRLLISWQSSAQIWKYQMSISGEHKPQTSSACSMKLQASILPQPSQSFDLLYASDTSDRRQTKEKNWTTVKSPALKNLRCALLVGPTELSKRHETIIEPPKKTLILKIVKIDCRLPAGGVLCEKLEILDTSSLYQVAKDKESIYNNETSNKTLQISEKNQHKYSERFLVIFAVQERSDTLGFEVNDQVMIYSPWQHLDLPGYKFPTLFSSYFKIQSRMLQFDEGRLKTDKGEWSKSPCNKKMKKKIVLTSWSCLCSTNSTLLPSICDSHNFHLKLKTDIFNMSLNDQHKVENVCGKFKVIEGSSNKLPLHNSERPQSWSIVEAIEKCGGLSDIPVTIILHVYRKIQIKDLSGKNNHWLLIGADIMGIFCTVTIPDRPLAKQELKLLLNEGEGTIRAFTELTVTQRHTDNKSPGLFSLLHSLHHAYQKAIKENEKLSGLNYYNNNKAPQSFCYNFTVTLGSTKSQLVNGISNIAISLPLWSVQEALKVYGVAQRGSVFLHIIYKVDGYLYVICPNIYSGTSDLSLFSRLNANHKLETSEPDKSMCSKQICLQRNCESRVTRISVQEVSTLPSWLAKNGTIMQGAIVRDIISYKGTLMVDGYSEIKIRTSEVNLTLGNLYHILPKLQSDCDSHQLVHVSGKICHVDEENAFSWPICEHCSSENLKEATMECSRCGKKSLSPKRGYSAEVFLDCIEIPNTSVKIKLYQRTIKKLISSCLVSEEEGYDANLMIGRTLGPLVCFIEEVKSRTIVNTRTFILLQLPY